MLVSITCLFYSPADSFLSSFVGQAGRQPTTLKAQVLENFSRPKFHFLSPDLTFRSSGSAKKAPRTSVSI